MIQAESIYNKATAEKLYKMVKEMQISKTDSKSIKESEKKTEVEYTTKFDFPLKDVADVLNFNKELELNKEYYSYLVSICLLPKTIFNFAASLMEGMVFFSLKSIAYKG